MSRHTFAPRHAFPARHTFIPRHTFSPRRPARRHADAVMFSYIHELSAAAKNP